MRILSFTLFFIATQVFGQINFFNLYTDVGDDFGEGIVQLEDSSYVITGSSSSFGYGSTDAFLLKIDSSGNYLWSKNYGGTESDQGRRVMYNPGDGFYVAGTTNSYGNGAYDFYLFKTDLNGDLLWERSYGGSGWEKLNDAVLTSDNHILFIGETSSNSISDRNSVLYKVNLNGDTIHTIQRQHIGTDLYSSMVYYQDTLYSLVGQMYDMDSLKWRSTISTYHLDGTLLWEDTVSIQGDCLLNDITFSNSLLYTVGGTEQNMVNPFGRIRIKHDLNGLLLSNNMQSTASKYYDKDICEYGNTGAFIITFEYEDSSIPGNGLDLAIWKYGFPFTNQNQWTPVPYVNDDRIGQTIKTLDGSVISVGSTSGYNTNYNNVFVSKIGPGSVFPNSTAPHNTQGLVGINTFDYAISTKISPNPATDLIRITGDFGTLNHVSITDIKGNQVLQSNSSQIDVRILESGIYFVTVDTDKGIARTRLVIQ